MSTHNSRQAYAHIAKTAPSIRAAIAQMIEMAGDDGLTIHEVVASTDWQYSTVSARFSELAEVGHITGYGSRKAPSGKLATVYITCDDPEEQPKRATRRMLVDRIEYLEARVAELEDELRAALEI